MRTKLNAASAKVKTESTRSLPCTFTLRIHPRPSPIQNLLNALPLPLADRGAFVARRPIVELHYVVSYCFARCEALLHEYVIPPQIRPCRSVCRHRVSPDAIH